MAAPKVMMSTRTFAIEVNGQQHIVRKGERLAASHPAVKARPQAFQPEATAGVRKA